VKAQMDISFIVPVFFNLGAGQERVVNGTPRLFTFGTDPLLILVGV